MGEGAHPAGDHTEHGVHEQSESRHTQQDVVQVRLLLRTELQRLHPAKRLGTGGRARAPFHNTTTGQSDETKTVKGECIFENEK